ncbi:MAG: histidine ammonia-lyase [Deltaproteobacteria bacterium]|nr:histidine ammonia-lyase [Deltaproteobacteria bacterium]
MGVVTCDPVFHPGLDKLNTESLTRLASGQRIQIKISEEIWQRLDQFRSIVLEKAEGELSCYGINTGFGYLSDVRIGKDQLDQLQQNLIRSHACGVGSPVSPDIVRAMIILKMHHFAIGYSGISRACMQALQSCLSHDLLPVIPDKGSVGASGDLAPLAHLALGMMGEGDVFFRGERIAAAQALREAGLKPFSPGIKEGLSLINGTHFMSSLAAFAVQEADTLLRSADIIAALSVDAFRGTPVAFDTEIQEVRPYQGQRLVAANLRTLLSGADEIRDSHKDCDKVQDPYSFRCIPQVHGASRDALSWIRDQTNTELNSVTDNPLVFPDRTVRSGGNFHGQPLALAMDFLCLAISEAGSLSERRTEKLTNPAQSGLPAFLSHNSGLNSGYMIPHVVSASLASENKTLCHPASADSIPTSADKEDHVSMGPIAARKAMMVNQNVAFILAIELLAACQALDLLSPLKPSAALSLIYHKVRELSPGMEQDRALYQDIDIISRLIREGGLIHLLKEAGLSLH